VLVVLPVLGLVGIAAIAQQQATSQQGTSQEGGVDPVAEAARKAREQKKAEPKPKKVFTNDDLGSAAPAPAAATPAPNAPAATASGNAETKENAESTANGDKDAADKSAGANKNGEQAWRKRFREARDKLAQAEQELDILQREAQKSQVQYYTDPQKALSEQYSRKEISDKDTKIDAKKQEVAQMKQHIADLEDELRKSGGDPGWAR
jgi:hypothetical protein